MLIGFLYAGGSTQKNNHAACVKCPPMNSISPLHMMTSAYGTCNRKPVCTEGAMPENEPSILWNKAVWFSEF